VSLRIGDATFFRGQPGVAVRRDDQKEIATIDQDPARVKQEFRHGYVNGMAPNDREKFNSFMDQVRELKAPNDRATLLQQKIDELEEDPANNRFLRKYLQAELWHVMHSNNIHPKEYNVPIRELRD
jgi:hypothetical protein